MGITAVIADRVKKFRTTARLSGAGLAGEMRKLGVQWTRTTVAKLETGRRESVTVQEWLALAVALDVPPVWLLADPASSGRVRIAPDVTVDPWAMMRWAAGRAALSSSTSARWDQARDALACASHAADLVQFFCRALVRRQNFERPPDAAGIEEDQRSDRYLLETLAGDLRHLSDGGFVVPTVPDFVSERANDLNIELAEG